MARRNSEVGRGPGGAGCAWGGIAAIVERPGDVPVGALGAVDGAGAGGVAGLAAGAAGATAWAPGEVVAARDGGAAAPVAGTAASRVTTALANLSGFRLPPAALDLSRSSCTFSRSSVPGCVDRNFPMTESFPPRSIRAVRKSRRPAGLYPVAAAYVKPRRSASDSSPRL